MADKPFMFATEQEEADATEIAALVARSRAAPGVRGGAPRPNLSRSP